LQQQLNKSDRRRRLRLTGLAAMAVLAAVLVAACGGSSGSSSTGGSTGSGGESGSGEESASKIVIGNLEVPPAGGGPDFTKGTEIAAKKINEEGGVEGHEIEIRTIKAGLGSQETLQAYRQAASDPEILAAWIGASGLAVKAQSEQVKLPAIICVGRTDAFVPPTEYFYQVCPGGQFATSSLDYAVKEKGAKKIGVLHYEADFSEGITSALESGCEVLGCEVVTEQKAENEAPAESLIPQLTALKNSGAEAYYIESLNPNAMKAARQLGMFEEGKPVIAEQWLTVPAIAEANGKAAEGVVFGGGKCREPDVLKNSDPAKKFCDTYRAEFAEQYPGEEFALFSVFGYDTVTLVAKAAEKALKNGEELTRESINTNLQKFEASENIRLSQGTVTSSPEKHELAGKWGEAYVNYSVTFPNGKLKYVLAEGANPEGAEAPEPIAESVE